MVNPMNPSLQQAMYQVPVTATDATYVAPQIAQQTAPQYQTNFGASQYAPAAEEHKSIFSLRNVLGVAVATTLLVAGVKTHNSSKAFEKALEKNLIAKGTEFKGGQTFLDHLNPLNWVGRDDAAKELEKHGFQALDKDNNRILTNGTDTLILNGKKARNVKDFAEFKAPETPKAPEAPKEDTPVASTTDTTKKKEEVSPATAKIEAPKSLTADEQKLYKEHLTAKKEQMNIARINKDIKHVKENVPNYKANDTYKDLKTELAEAEQKLVDYVRKIDPENALVKEVDGINTIRQTLKEAKTSNAGQDVIDLANKELSQAIVRKNELIQNLTLSQKHQNAIKNAAEINATREANAETTDYNPFQKTLKNSVETKEAAQNSNKVVSDIEAEIQRQHFNGEKIEKAELKKLPEGWSKYFQRRSVAKANNQATKYNNQTLEKLEELLKNNEAALAALGGDVTSPQAIKLQTEQMVLRQKLTKFAPAVAA